MKLLVLIKVTNDCQENKQTPAGTEFTRTEKHAAQDSQARRLNGLGHHVAALLSGEYDAGRTLVPRIVSKGGGGTNCD